MITIQGKLFKQQGKLMKFDAAEYIETQNKKTEELKQQNDVRVAPNTSVKKKS
jgi:hypothetical protein